MADTNSNKEIDALKGILKRERQIRKNAELIIEEKSREIYLANQALIDLNKNLEELVKERTNELEKALSARDAFISNIGHELNTPIHLILGNLSLLEEEISEDHRLSRIFEEINKLKNIVNDLVMLTEIDSGKFSSELKNINLKSFIIERLMAVEALSKKQQVSIKKDLNEILLFTDPLIFSKAIEKLIKLLIHNSFKNSILHIFSVQDDIEKLIIKSDGEYYKLKYLEVFNNPLDQWDGTNIHNLGSLKLEFALISKLFSLIDIGFEFEFTDKTATIYLIFNLTYNIESSQNDLSSDQLFDYQFSFTNNEKKQVVEKLDSLKSIFTIDTMVESIEKLTQKVKDQELSSILKNIMIDLDNFDIVEAKNKISKLKEIIENDK
jgi:light-regulated signal transduction histidine kinase (bacteriophytochrome)